MRQILLFSARSHSCFCFRILDWLEVKVHSYINPSHRDASGQCCYFLPFSLPDCISQCSNTFVFCPFDITSQPAGPDNCPLGMQLFKGNDNIVGLDYTLIFNGTLWPVGCQKCMYYYIPHLLFNYVLFSKRATSICPFKFHI